VTVLGLHSRWGTPWGKGGARRGERRAERAAYGVVMPKKALQERQWYAYGSMRKGTKSGCCSHAGRRTEAPQTSWEDPRSAAGSDKRHYVTDGTSAVW